MPPPPVCQLLYVRSYHCPNSEIWITNMLFALCYMFFILFPGLCVGCGGGGRWTCEQLSFSQPLPPARPSNLFLALKLQIYWRRVKILEGRTVFFTVLLYFYISYHDTADCTRALSTIKYETFHDTKKLFHVTEKKTNSKYTVHPQTARPGSNW